MRLEIYNYKIHKEKIIDVPDSSLSLLFGNSGAGKTTVLSALYYVLYGKVRNINQKKEKTKVILTFKDLHIVRSKPPNSLTVTQGKEEYEGDVAQKIIDSIFGNHFTITSYIVQKKLNSFISMDPSKKVKFLEEIALKDFDVQSLKKKIKDKINELFATISETETKLNQLLTDSLCKQDAPVEPLNNKRCKPRNTLKKYKKSYCNLLTLIKKLKEEVCTCEDQIEKYQTLLSTKEKYLFQKSEYNQRINSLATEMKHLEETKKEVNFIGDEKLLYYANLYDTVVNHKQLLSQITQHTRDLQVSNDKILSLKDVNFNFRGTEYINLLKEGKVLYKKYMKRKVSFDKLSAFKNDASKRIQEFDSILSTLKKRIMVTFSSDRIKEIETSISEYNNFQKYKEQIKEIDLKLQTNKNTTDFSKIKKNEEQLLLLKRDREVLLQHSQACPNCGILLKISSTFKIERAQLSQTGQTTSLTFIDSEISRLNVETNLLKKTRDTQTVLCSQKKLLESQIEGCGVSKSLNIDNLVNELNKMKSSNMENESTLEQIKRIEKEKLEYTHNSTLKVSVFEKDLEENEIQHNIDNPVLKELNIKSVEDLNESTYESLEQIEVEQNVERERTDKKNSLILELQGLKTSLEKKIDALNETIHELKIPNEPLSEEDINKLLKEQNVVKEKIKMIQDNIKSKQDERTKLQETVSQIQIDDVDYNELISHCGKELNEKNSTLNKYESSVQGTCEYLEYLEKLEKYKAYSKRTKELKTTIKENENRKIRLEIFMKKIQETESKMCQNMIEEVCFRMNSYLEKFFDDAISVNILTTKETKGNIKNTVVINVNYKDRIMDISDLSGRELDRVILSFVLSLTSIMNLPFLLLDESLSSLDESLCNKILGVLKDEKICTIVVSHQASTGLFDKVIEI